MIWFVFKEKDTHACKYPYDVRLSSSTSFARDSFKRKNSFISMCLAKERETWEWNEIYVAE